VKIRELKRLIAAMPDDLDVFIEIYEHEVTEDLVQAPALKADIEYRCADVPALFIYASTDPDDAPDNLNDPFDDESPALEPA
jgi:hypothetical protein